MLKILYSLFFLLFLFLEQAGAVTPPNYYFKQISIDQGLSRSTIRTILRSSQGIIWVGTPYGLNRIDRDELKVYLHESEDESSLPHNFIRFVAEDAQNTIWVSTGGGLVCYDADSDSFLSMLGSTKIYSYQLVKSGILFGGVSKMYFYSYATRQFKKLPLFPIDEDQQTPFTKILERKDSSFFLVSKERGIWKYDPKTGHTKRLLSLERSRGDITMAKQDGYENLYISYFQQGIHCFSPDGKQRFHLTTSNSNLSNDIILDMAYYNGKLWLATDGGGISILDTTNMTFSSLRHIPGNIKTLPVNSISCLHVDSDNNLWAGSVRGGMFGIKEVHIQTYKDVTQNTVYGLSNKAVISMYKEPSGILWVGTDGGGLNRFNPTTKTFQHYPSTFDGKVISVTGFTQNELLISLFSKRLYIFNKQTGIYRPFTIIDSETDHLECASGFLALAYQISKNKTCILARNIYLYDNTLKNFSRIKTSGNRNLLSAQQMVWSNDSVTYLTKNNKIFEFTHKELELKEIFSFEEAGEPEPINTIIRDSSGCFWIGSIRGLSMYDPRNSRLERISTNLFSNILSLAQDQFGHLWIGANNMLFSYVKDEKRFMVWNESDGFFPNELLFLPLLQPVKEKLYMGGNEGLVEINPHIGALESEVPRLFLREVVVNGAVISLDNKNPILTIPWNYTSCVLKVALSDKDLFRKVLFHHRLQGERSKVVETYNNQLSLPALSPGRYQLISSCNMKNGNWTASTRLLEVIIMPPWYFNGKVILSFLLLLIILIGYTAYIIIRKKENKLKWAIQKEKQKNDEDKIRFLLNVSHELRTPLTLICSPLKRMLKHELPQEEKLKQQLHSLYKQAGHMKNTINMVLDINKISEGLYKLHCTNYLLNDWVREIGEEFYHEFENKMCRLEYTLDPQIETLYFDQEKCRIVLCNFLMNALKFTDTGNKIVISTQRLNETIRISIVDEGIGLENIDPQQIFSHFQQGNHNREGSGIGLAYAKMLVELHGGQIGAYNNNLQGATFYFELPLKQNDVKQTASPVIDFCGLLTEVSIGGQQIVPFDLSAYNLLIVEDKEELNAFLKEELKGLFKKIYTASDGEKALKMVQEYLPDLVISDVMMPYMNGYELCHRIKKDETMNHVQVILLTAITNEEQIKQGYKLGADFYIGKPFEMDFLLTIARKLLGNREMIKLRYKNQTSIDIVQPACQNNVDEKFMQHLHQIILTNLNNTSLDVTSITDQMPMSRAVLYKKVKALTGLGINDYINKIRIERSEILLRESNLSITEISEMVGFSYQRYFSSVFKQAKGVLPSVYRQEHHKKEEVEKSL